MNTRSTERDRPRSWPRLVLALLVTVAVAGVASVEADAKGKGKRKRDREPAAVVETTVPDAGDDVDADDRDDDDEQDQDKKDKGKKGKDRDDDDRDDDDRDDEDRDDDRDSNDDSDSAGSTDWWGSSSSSITDWFAAGDDTTSLREVVEQIGADDLWQAGFTGDGIDVALIDTGVAPVAELSTTDVFVGPDLSFEAGIPELTGLDSYGHGTHMAGIIAGRTPGADPLAPGEGDLLGVAPDAGIVSVKVADNTGSVDVSQVIAAIDWVVQHRDANGLNIRVLNLSYNTSSQQSYVDDPLSKAIENAWNHGIVVVVSAGNEGFLSRGLASPATNPRVLAVSSAEWWNDFAWINPSWAPSGDGQRNPDILAPGVSIESLRVPGSRIDAAHASGRVEGDDRLFLGSGTSQSAAVISGAAALLLDQRPDLTPDEVKQLLTSTARDTFQFDVIKGSGVVDLTAAMAAEPGPSEQSFEPATGLGSLDAARGDDHVTLNGESLVGEVTFTGTVWDPAAWVEASESGSTWSGSTWSGSTWSGSTWSGSTWSGSTWSGSTWSGSTWSGSTWSGSTWSGSTWSGSTWSGSTWSGSTWSGSTWSGSTWSGSTWSGSTWSGSTWSGSSWS